MIRAYSFDPDEARVAGLRSREYCWLCRALHCSVTNNDDLGSGTISMRLFVALNLPQDVRTALWAATATLREAGLPVRWVGAPQLHLTMHFLGEVSDRQAEHALQAVVSAAAPGGPVALHVHGVGAFPSLGNPRVVWIGIQATPELAELHDRLAGCLMEAGFECDTRPFHPHVTLGRIKRGVHRSELRDLRPLAGSVRFESRFTVETVELMRSHLGPHGARYSVVSAVPLREAPG
jgi:2'-5' RNA ligase